MFIDINNKHVRFIILMIMTSIVIILINYNIYIETQQSIDDLYINNEQLIILNKKIDTINNSINNSNIHNNNPYFNEKKELSINDLQSFLLRKIENENSLVISFQSNYNNDSGLIKNTKKIESFITFQTNNDSLQKILYNIESHIPYIVINNINNKC